MADHLVHDNGSTVVLVEGISDGFAVEAAACAVGPQRIEEIIKSEGELQSLRRLQQMPFHRHRSTEENLTVRRK